MIALLTFVAFAASTAAVRVFIAVTHGRILAQPGARSSHISATPTGGGFPAVVAFLAVSAGAAAFAQQPGPGVTRLPEVTVTEEQLREEAPIGTGMGFFPCKHQEEIGNLRIIDGVKDLGSITLP